MIGRTVYMLCVRMCVFALLGGSAITGSIVLRYMVVPVALLERMDVG